ncbi:hypothetical protein HYV88_03470 [Candidatus Woesearchaeota archaeon]|nr:hypothetical protein [Candidatus Woesearchaeota archaeon]
MATLTMQTQRLESLDDLDLLVRGDAINAEVVGGPTILVFTGESKFFSDLGNCYTFGVKDRQSFLVYYIWKTGAKVKEGKLIAPNTRGHTIHWFDGTKFYEGIQKLLESEGM